MKIVNSIISLISLFIGGIIYLAYRSKDLIMFDWFNDIGCNDIIEDLRLVAKDITLPSWIIYSLPDGLWLFSYLLIIDLVWGNHKSIKYYIYYFMLPTIAIIIEFIELFFPTIGTFDIIDIISYLSAIILDITLKSFIK